MFRLNTQFKLVDLAGVKILDGRRFPTLIPVLAEHRETPHCGLKPKMSGQLDGTVRFAGQRTSTAGDRGFEQQFDLSCVSIFS